MKSASFWRRKEMKERYALLHRVALHYLSVPLSSASVERAFSKLTRMESPLRKSLLDEGVRREHFLQCHKATVETKLAASIEQQLRLTMRQQRPANRLLSEE